jgi:hypothetical protein
MLVAKRGTDQREERLIKALRDNLRRRKALSGDAAKPASRIDAPQPRQPTEPKQPS